MSSNVVFLCPKVNICELKKGRILMLNKKFIVAVLTVAILFLGIFSFAQSNNDDTDDKSKATDKEQSKDNDKTQQSNEVDDQNGAVNNNPQNTQPTVNTQTNEQNNTATEPTRKEVTITFNSNGGSSVIAQKIIAGSVATKPNDPVWAGHKFLGWDYNNGTWNFTWAVNDNLTLIAKWEVIEQPIADVYTMNVGNIPGDAFAPEGRVLIYKNNVDISSSVQSLKSGSTPLGSYIASIGGIRINKGQFSNYSSFQVVLNDGTTHEVK
jgi:hypothetical protein